MGNCEYHVSYLQVRVGVILKYLLSPRIYLLGDMNINIAQVDKYWWWYQEI